MIRKIGMGMATVLLAVSMTACTVGQGVSVPEREVPLSVETALEAQNMAMNGLMAGSVSWDEAQFSSLLTELLRANSGANTPVESITAWFEPDVVFLRVDVKDGVLPPAFGNTLEVAGSLDIQNGTLMVNLDEAAAGTYKVEGAALEPINQQINAALANQQLGVPVSLDLTEGMLTISMTQ